MLSVVISGGKVFAHLLGEFHRGVVAHALLAVVDGRDLEDDGKVPAGRDGDGDRRDLHAENFGVLRLDAEPVIRLAVAPRDHVDDEVDVGAFLDRAHAEQLRDVDDADAAQLDIMLEYRRRGADQLMRRDLFDLNGVVGAIIILANGNMPKTIIDSGVIIDSEISSALIESIFFPKTPLHDGAMVINGSKVHAAGCFLPLSQEVNLPKELGTRHRAGIGITETISVTSLIVSEETGIISIAQGGKIKRYVDSEMLRQTLKEYYWQELIEDKE